MELMNGVEVLSSVSYTDDLSSKWILGILIVSTITFIFSMAMIFFSDDIEVGTIGTVVLVSAISMFYSTAMFLEEPSENKIQYKVTISDEVNLNEFLDKYEIVDVDGKIYTIEEKSVDN